MNIQNILATPGAQGEPTLRW